MLHTNKNTEHNYALLPAVPSEVWPLRFHTFTDRFFTAWTSCTASAGCSYERCSCHSWDAENPLPTIMDLCSEREEQEAPAPLGWHKQPNLGTIFSALTIFYSWLQSKSSVPSLPRQQDLASSRREMLEKGNQSSSKGKLVCPIFFAGHSCTDKLYPWLPGQACPTLHGAKFSPAVHFPQSTPIPTGKPKEEGCSRLLSRAVPASCFSSYTQSWPWTHPGPFTSAHCLPPFTNTGSHQLQAPPRKRCSFGAMMKGRLAGKSSQLHYKREKLFQLWWY